MIDDLEANEEAMRNALERGFPTATDLADYLVREMGMPFRDAHHVTGRIVAMASERQCRLDELSLADLQTVETRLTDAIFDVLSVDSAVASRRSFGGTAPDNVKAAVQAAKERFL